jgi:hypothetical protein
VTADPTQEAFDEAVASARKAYAEAMAPFYKILDVGVKSATKAYEDAVAAAREARDRAIR